MWYNESSNALDIYIYIYLNLTCWCHLWIVWSKETIDRKSYVISNGIQQNNIFKVWSDWLREYVEKTVYLSLLSPIAQYIHVFESWLYDSHCVIFFHRTIYVYLNKVFDYMVINPIIEAYTDTHGSTVTLEQCRG